MFFAFGWIESVLLRYRMDWIDACESIWIQLLRSNSRYLVKVHHGNGGIAPRTRVYFAFAGVLTIRDTSASAFPLLVCCKIQ